MRVTFCFGVVLTMVLTGVASAQQAPAPATPPVASPRQPAPPQEPVAPPEEPRGRRGRPSSGAPEPAPRGRVSSRTRESRVAGPTRQSLRWVTTVQAGYDDNRTDMIDEFAPQLTMPDGPVGMLTSGLGYQRGNEARAVNLDVSGSAVTYPEYVDGFLTGGSASAGAKSRVGRSLTLAGSGRVSYDPLFNALFPASGGQFGPGLADVVPSTGLYQQRSLSTSGTGTLEQKFGAAGVLTASYSYGRFSFTNDTSDTATPRDNNSQTVTTTYAHAVTPDFRLRAAYAYGTFGFASDDIASSDSQRIEGGVTIGRAPVSFSAQVGGARLTSTTSDNVPYQVWVPSGNATLGLTRERWGVQALYSRDFSLLQGISTDVFVLDQFSLQSTFVLTRRTSLGVSASYASWGTPEAAQVANAFDVVGLQIQIGHKLTDWLSVIANYGRYDHTFVNPDALPGTFPPNFGRHSLRAGLSVDIPLLGGGRRTRRSAP